MIGAIELFMTRDHARLDRLLRKTTHADGGIDADAYAELRRDLLRHIAMEEKVLLPFARTRRNGEPLPMAKALRVDHGQIARLLVPTPSSSLVGNLCALLGRHNALEEGPGGLYAVCDMLAGPEGSEVVARLAAQPAVPVAPHYDGPLLSRR
jgi:hypothetical protein